MSMSKEYERIALAVATLVCDACRTLWQAPVAAFVCNSCNFVHAEIDCPTCEAHLRFSTQVEEIVADQQGYVCKGIDVDVQ